MNSISIYRLVSKIENRKSRVIFGLHLSRGLEITNISKSQNNPGLVLGLGFMFSWNFSFFFLFLFFLLCPFPFSILFKIKINRFLLKKMVQ